MVISDGEVPTTPNMWLALRDQSWANAEALVASGEYRKGAEMAWGAVEQGVHALALARGKPVDQSHGSLKRYIQTITKEQHDLSLADGYRAAERLHANFFVNFLEPREVLELLNSVRGLLGALETLTPLTN